MLFRNNYRSFGDASTLADNELVHATTDMDLQSGRDAYTDSLDEYRAIVEKYIHDQDVVGAILTHESKHMEVAKAVGLKAVYAFHKRDGYVPYVNCYGSSVPKIAAAAIAAAPLDPSLGDMRVVQSLGYEGIADIGDRITGWNRNNNGIFIPLPMTYEPGMAGSRFCK